MQVDARLRKGYAKLYNAEGTFILAEAASCLVWQTPIASNSRAPHVWHSARETRQSVESVA